MLTDGGGLSKTQNHQHHHDDGCRLTSDSLNGRKEGRREGGKEGRKEVLRASVSNNLTVNRPSACPVQSRDHSTAQSVLERIADANQSNCGGGSRNAGRQTNNIMATRHVRPTDWPTGRSVRRRAGLAAPNRLLISPFCDGGEVRSSDDTNSLSLSPASAGCTWHFAVYCPSRQSGPRRGIHHPGIRRRGPTGRTRRIRAYGIAEQGGHTSVRTGARVERRTAAQTLHSIDHVGSDPAI